MIGFKVDAPLWACLQEISLHTYLSIKEVMIFYGYLFSMDDEKIRERAKLLSEMLDLPPLHKMVSNLR